MLSLALLGVILPAVLLTTFKLTGVLKETSLETITIEPVTWEFEKCSGSTDYPLWFNSPNETHVSNTYKEGVASITHTAVPKQYIVNFSDYEESSFLSIGLNLTASVAEGFVESIRIIFSGDNMSEVDLFGASSRSYPNLNRHFYTWENLTIKDWAHYFYGKSRLEGNQKAFIEAIGQNQPRKVSFSALGVHWILEAPENVSQQLEITAEVTYFNGISHIKVVLPIMINLIADVGNTFEDAKTIDAGSYRGSLSVFDYDFVDYYRIWLLNGQTVRLRAALREVGDVNLTLYDPATNLVAYVSSGRYYDEDPHFVQELTYTIDADGYWHIKISTAWFRGIYLLNVKVE